MAAEPGTPSPDPVDASRDGEAELLVVGDVNPDIVVTGVPPLRFGQKEDVTGPTVLTLGGSAAIVAAGAARLGTRVSIVAVTGDDVFGDFCRAALASRSVRSEHLRVVAGGRTGSSVILSPRDGRDRHILTDRGVMQQLRVPVDLLADFAELRHLHLCSWFLHSNSAPHLTDLLAAAHARGVHTSVDPNDDPSGQWQSGLLAGLRHVRLLFCNEQEAVGLAGGDGDPLAAAALLLTRLAGDDATVVLKCGAGGAYVLSQEGTFRARAPRVEVRDAIGAGDTLAAAYLHVLSGGGSRCDALRLGVAAGSLATRQVGGTFAQPFPNEAAAVAQTMTVDRMRIIA